MVPGSLTQFCVLWTLKLCIQFVSWLFCCYSTCAIMSQLTQAGGRKHNVRRKLLEDKETQTQDIFFMYIYMDDPPSLVRSALHHSATAYVCRTDVTQRKTAQGS